MASNKTDETAKIKRLAYAEVSRLKKLLKDNGIQQKNVEFLHPVIQNVAMMKVKLEKVRGTLLDEELTIEYDNGGGQTGIKENPAFSAYEGLWKSYMQGMNKIFEVLQGGKTQQGSVKAEKKTALELVMERHRKEA